MATRIGVGLDLARARDRRPLGPTAEGLSGATFERLTLDGSTYVVKRLSAHSDWVMRAAQDLAVPYAARLHADGVFARLDAVDTALVEVAFDPATGLLELLMEDVGEFFLRDEDPITLAQHTTVIEAMAALHAQSWGWEDTWGLTPPGARFQMFTPSFARAEARRGPLTGVPSVLIPMWEALSAVAPEMYAVVSALAAEPTPLVAALARGPRALIHGDWKGGNLALRPGGRVVLVDWAFPGIDAPLLDLAWYLAVNCDRLPEPKERCLARYREALEGAGVATGGWWDEQLALGLLGGAVQMAWSKVEQPEELAWWAAWVAEGLRVL